MHSFGEPTPKRRGAGVARRGRLWQNISHGPQGLFNFEGHIGAFVIMLTLEATYTALAVAQLSLVV